MNSILCKQVNYLSKSRQNFECFTKTQTHITIQKMASNSIPRMLRMLICLCCKYVFNGFGSLHRKVSKPFLLLQAVFPFPSAVGNFQSFWLMMIFLPLVRTTIVKNLSHKQTDRSGTSICMK